MRPEWRWGLAVALMFSLGVFGASAYARLATPYSRAVIELLEAGHPWKTVDIDVVPDEASHGRVLRLRSEVRRRLTSRRPAALVVSTVQVGEAVETPIVFWTLVLLWPARTAREYLVRLAVGIPVFLGIEAATTACQLVNPLAEASALLAGEQSPLTLWERWSRFLEAGGRFALEVAAAILPIALDLRRPTPHAAMRT